MAIDRLCSAQSGDAGRGALPRAAGGLIGLRLAMILSDSSALGQDRAAVRRWRLFEQAGRGHAFRQGRRARRHGLMQVIVRHLAPCCTMSRGFEGDPRGSGVAGFCRTMPMEG